VVKIQRWWTKGANFLKNVLRRTSYVANRPTQWTQIGTFTSGEAADEHYEAIRRNTTDVEEIARNTGLKPENIAKVKRHLFEEAHLLDRYVDYGIPAEMKRFDSDIGIAQAWERLRRGNFTAEDLQLLRHEAAEAWYMRHHGPSYRAAHNAAEKRFPAPKLNA
jgi:hypothetical protein